MSPLMKPAAVDHFHLDPCWIYAYGALVVFIGSLFLKGYTTLFIAFTLISLIPLFFYLFRGYPFLHRLIALGGILFLFLYYIASLDPLLEAGRYVHESGQGTDAFRYHDLMFSYDSYWEYVRDRLNWEGLIYGSAYTMFGLYHYPFFFWVGDTNPRLIYVLNLLSFLIYIYTACLLTQKHFRSLGAGFHHLFFILICFNPLFIYYTALFQKDVATAACSLLAAWYLLERKWLWFLLFTFISIGLRVYAILFIFLYVAFFSHDNRKFYGIVIATFLFMIFYTSFDWYTIPKSLFLFLNCFNGPSLHNLSNWLNAMMLFSTLQSLGLTVTLFLTLFLYPFGFHRDKQLMYFLFASLFVFAFFMVAYDYSFTVNGGLPFNLASVNDDMVRKKIQINIFLIFLTSFIWTCLINKKSTYLTYIKIH